MYTSTATSFKAKAVKSQQLFACNATGSPQHNNTAALTFHLPPQGAHLIYPD